MASQQTNLGSVCDQPATEASSLEIIGRMYVYHRICLDFKYGSLNRGSFVRSQSIQKENKRTAERTLGTQIKGDVENFKPGRDPVSYRKPRFCKRQV